MADPPESVRTGRLDASGNREVVYCWQCENEWYRDAHGLICPRCEGEVTEIVSVLQIHIDLMVLTSVP